MPKIAYIKKALRSESLQTILQANEIIDEYESQGYDLTLRQLYYQFVSRDLIANNMREYKKLGSVINNGRLLGLIDWAAIVDRTRGIKGNSHWASPKEIIQICADQFEIDKWSNQDYRPEVWIEKDALIGVIGGICSRLDVPYFSCRGYTSQSAMWVAGRRLQRYYDNEQAPIIFHFGDHDPSGMDMTRDIEDRMDLFCDGVDVQRIALNMDQVDKYSPPPNPSKLTDTRARSYIDMYGSSSWELDALEPSVIEKLIEANVLMYRDDARWQQMLTQEQEHKDKLLDIAEREF